MPDIKMTKKCSRCGEIKLHTEFSRSARCKDGLNYVCKECLKIYCIKNKERIREYRKNRYNKIKDSPAYKKQKKEYMAEYHKKHWEEHKKKAIVYRAKNKEKIRENSKKYRESNRDKKRILSSTYKSRKRANGGRVTLKQLNKLVEDSHNICFWCNSNIPEGKMHFDHVYPLAKGGKHHISNIVVSCQHCNNKKGSKDPEVFLQEILRGDI